MAFEDLPTERQEELEAYGVRANHFDAVTGGTAADRVASLRSRSVDSVIKPGADNPDGWAGHSVGRFTDPDRTDEI